MAKILLVDDEPQILDTCEELLRAVKIEYEVYKASTWDRALAYLEQIKFDLVILDIVMPGKNGIEILHHIKRRNGCPVIIQSGYLHQIPEAELYREGADLVLGKPVPFDLFVNSVRNLVEPDLDTTLILVHGYKIREIKNQVLATMIQKVLRKTEGGVQEAARLMGVSRECLSMMMRRLQITR